MRLFTAVGTAILLVTLALLLPPVFRELGKTLVLVLQVAQEGLHTASSAIASVSQFLP